MLLGEILEEFRNQVDDSSQPYLWDDKEVFRYLVEAQDQFAIRMGGFEDSSTTALIDLPLVANSPWSAISPYVLRIRTARLLTAKTPVKIINQGQLGNVRIDDYGQSIGTDNLDDTNTGDVKYGVLGLEAKKIRWINVPAVNDTCRIMIYRLPYPRMTDWDGAELEVEEQHHRTLMLWMKHLAYGKQDAETLDKKASEDAKAAFIAACEEAKVQKRRRAYKPGAVLMTGWGGS